MIARPHLTWTPSTEPPWPAMLILHGAGSAKENHADFGRLCAAAGWLAVAYDQRGHGESEDEMSPAVIDDACAAARALAARPEVDRGRICARGSSMGGFVAIHATAACDRLSGAIAICPAAEEQLLRGMREDRLEFRAGQRARAELTSWLETSDIDLAAERLGPKPLILLHADADERVPSDVSRRLHARAVDPRRLVIVPGGHHRSVQHDAELQGEALRWLARSLAARNEN